MKNRISHFLLITLVILSLFTAYTDALAIERVNIAPSTTNAKAPKNYVFQLKGSSNKYILLDSTEEGYFILSLKYCAIRKYSQSGTACAFDPESQNCVAYWLNHDYLTDTSLSKRLPQVMINNLIERDYPTEGGGSHNPAFARDYTVRCKIVLLSQTEWSKYNARYGYADDTSSAYWFLRTARELTGAPLVATSASGYQGQTVEGKWTSSAGIRPAFYLSKDFFAQAKIDVENSGDAVISTIRQDQDITTLAQLYSSYELELLLQSDIAPMADTVTVTGRGIVGEKIQGKYNFVALDDNAEDGTMYQWQKSQDGQTWSTIVGATTTEYVPTSSDIGYKIRLKVSPMTGTMAGASYESAPLACDIRPISTPVASNVRIECGSVVKPGDILDARYTYSDENRDICSSTKYRWESSDDMVTTTKVTTTRYCKLSNAESGKYIRVGVTPRKKTNSSPTPRTVEGEIVYSDWVKVEDLPCADNVEIFKNMKMDIRLTISKSESGISVGSMFSPSDSVSDVDKLQAEYTIPEGEGYDVVCEWQGAAEQNGEYSRISSGSDTLEYVPENTLWVRAMVYAKDSQNNGKAEYSEPIFIGQNKPAPASGEYTLTQNLESGKTYEIWIINDTARNSYSYSFNIAAGSSPTVTSDKYMVTVFPRSGGSGVVGTLVSDVYGRDLSFKAGEITVPNSGTITISDVLTASPDGDGDSLPTAAAKVFIKEK